MPDLDPGQELESFTASFSLQIGGSGSLADGLSLSFGAIPAGNGGGEAGFAVENGLIIGWDTYNNGGDPPSIEVFSDGVSVGNFPHNYGSTASDWVSVVLHWDSSGLDLNFNGSALATNLATPGFVPSAGDRFAFSGRTGGANQNSFLDNLSFTTETQTPIATGGLVITEFVADNEDSLDDEDLDSSDWLELYNGQGSSRNLGGHYLTNDVGNPLLWQLPAVTIGAYEYLTVFASGKARAVVGAPLHTNFTLPKDGGYLALVAPDGATVLSEFTFGAQSGDVAFGELGQARTLGYLETPTPGEKNSGLQAAWASGRGCRVRQDGWSVLRLDDADYLADGFAGGCSALHDQRHGAKRRVGGLRGPIQHLQYDDRPREGVRDGAPAWRNQEPHTDRACLRRAGLHLEPADRDRRFRWGQHRRREQPERTATVPQCLHGGGRPRCGGRAGAHRWGSGFYGSGWHARARAELLGLPEETVCLGDLEQ